MKKQNLFEIVTNKIITALEGGRIPWRKTWKISEPMNLVSKKAYRGLNNMLLSSSEFKSPYWLTFKQVQDLKGSIIKGSKSTLIVFWQLNKKDEKAENVETEFNGFLLRYYLVFNLEQCILPDEVLKDAEIHLETKMNNERQEAEDVLKGYKNAPKVIFGNYNPCYVPALDEVRLPNIVNFESSNEYYATLFHELVHSTGHANRLHRFSQVSFKGSELYSKEELVAEIGASFLNAHVGIDDCFENTTAYLQSWLKVLKDDSKMIVFASSQATKAVDLILNKSYDQPDRQATAEEKDDIPF